MLCISAAYAVMRCPSVHPSVCLSVTFVNSVKTSNFHILRLFFTIGYPNRSSFCVSNDMTIFRRTPHNGGVECKWGRKKSRSWTNSWLSIDDWLTANNKCDGDRAVYRTDGDASVNIFVYHILQHARPRRIEENTTYAAVNLKLK